MTYSVFTGTVNRTQSNQWCHCCPGDKNDISPVTVPLILKVLFCNKEEECMLRVHKLTKVHL